MSYVLGLIAAAAFITVGIVIVLMGVIEYDLVLIVVTAILAWFGIVLKKQG